MESNKNKLLPDEETAPIVRDIFKWRAEGMGKAAIVKRLEALGIPCPSMRLRNKGKVKGEGYYKATVWQPKAIDKIICSKVYLGHLVQGKTSQALYEHKSIEFLPESEWCIVENTHEPIISLELWESANKVNSERRQNYLNSKKEQNLPDNIFKGLLICGVCGSKMVRTRNAKRQFEYYYYHCNLKIQHKDDTNSAMIPVKHIYDLVHSSINKQLKLADEKLEVLKKRKIKNENPCATIDRKISQVVGALQGNTKKHETLYENYVERLLTEVEYISFKKEYEQRDEMLKRELEGLYQQKNFMADTLSANNDWISALNEFRNLKELSRNMVLALIERIVINSPDSIEIVMKYRDEIKLLDINKSESLTDNANDSKGIAAKGGV